tara:strand:+ start:342 stop:1199 length:858 start_codon:yes stop_codon:yes gene_type:complete
MRTEEFYNFMIKREKLRLIKSQKGPWPWSNDDILNNFKFTNVKRSMDRTTKWFWDERLDKNKEADPSVILFNCALFRYFGTIEFSRAVGWINEWDESMSQSIKETAKNRLANKERVFTGAYVITNQGIKAPKQNVVVDYFLTPFWEKAPEICNVAENTRTWEHTAKMMMGLKGFGGSGFMTKEILQDALHTKVFPTCTDTNTWCPVGPGAKRGLNRVLGFHKDAKLNNGLEVMIRLFDERCVFWPEDWVTLELHDIQFQLCEFDKYERVKHGEGRPRSLYKKRKG